MKNIQRLFAVDPWKIATSTLDKKNKRLQESLTSIGNGYMGMRGNFEENYSGDHHLGTYLAGVWYPDKTRVGWWKNGYPDYFGKVINAVNFLAMSIYINGHEVDLAKNEATNFYLALDMKTGILRREFVLSLAGATVKFSFERFLSIVKKELAVIRLDMEVLSGQAEIKILSKLDNHIHNEDSNYDELFWHEEAHGSNPDFTFLQAKTIPNPFGIEQFTVSSAMWHNHKSDYTETSPLVISDSFTFNGTKGSQFALEKKVLILTSRDIPAEDHLEKLSTYHKAYEQTYEVLKAEQEQAWAKRWQLADVVIEGDEAAQQGIRFNLFQLFSTYYGEDERLNIGPKGFTGEKYGGATYWDTEAYAVPLYLALAKPEVSRNLLKYRHNQLPEAFINAKKQGLKGALYPMVTFTGIECHNEWEITFEEIHRNGAIAYAIYNYTNYTGDTSYLEKEGLEVLTAISRFWADRVHYSKRQQKYMIHGVTGPNEYENNINNNWYTNKMAVWVLKYTLDSYEQFKKNAPVMISEDEQTKWRDIIDNMYFPEDKKLGIFVQHDTFLDKDLMPVANLAPADLPLNQKWSWDHILRSCFIKQADVLQGIYFFGDQFTAEEKQRNFDFYEPMTVHESSLSPCIHGILAAELGLEEKALEMYSRTSRLDLDNYNNDTEDGLHITSMTGSWLAIVQGFAQMKTDHETLRFAPFLPKKWQRYAFHINYRGRLLYLAIDAAAVKISLIKGKPLQLEVYGNPHMLTNELVVSLS